MSGHIQIPSIALTAKDCGNVQQMSGTSGTLRSGISTSIYKKGATQAPYLALNVTASHRTGLYMINLLHRQSVARSIDECVIYSSKFTFIFLTSCCISTGLGTWMDNTPFVYLAVTLSTSTLNPRGICRWNVPNERSLR